MNRNRWVTALANGCWILLLASAGVRSDSTQSDTGARQDSPAAVEAAPSTAEIPAIDAAPASDTAPATDAAPATAEPAAADAAATPEPAAEADPVICRKSDATGSRVRPQKVCRTRSQWAAMD